jgi:hypothetical protein
MAWSRVLVAILLALSIHVAVHARKLDPVDEARAQPSFLAFRNRLAEAVRERDAAFLLGAVDPQIRVSFGDENGIAAFKKQWQPEDPRSPIWRELGEILALGGTFGYQGAPGFWAPYVYSRWPEDLDAFQHLAVLRGDVTVRSRPSSSAPIIDRLSYDIVKRGDGDPGVERRPDGPRAWQPVITPRGRKGYVQALFLRSPGDYRAHFRQAGDQWRLDMLVAGD